MCYIEKRFLELTENRRDGEKLRNKWAHDKEVYASRTSTTVFDFQHFSMHDKTHSERILQNIELLLGRERIRSHMELGDLWLLLQCAYFHDIGMSLTHKEVVELWKDADFKNYLADCLKNESRSMDRELLDSVRYYRIVDDLLRGKVPLQDVLEERAEWQGEAWPVFLSRCVQLIVAEFIRKNHGERSRKFFNKILKEDSAYDKGIVDGRLYRLVGEISYLHVKDYDEIFTRLRYEEVAFGDEHIHPQFIASLLRIGDVLDMDNNRFNYRILEHHGPLPTISNIHREKHRALTNFNITEKGITAKTWSDNFDVCLEARKWYDWVEDEFEHLTSKWNKIAPPNLKGCLLEECDLEVYLGNSRFSTKDFNHFNFDTRKMHKLLIGDNIYDCKLDCLREYVQNAIDATKVWLWEHIKHERQLYLRDEYLSLDQVLPMDLEEGTFQHLPIKVLLSFEKSTSSLTDKIRIEIHDNGIGMDNACVESITTIGKGWRSRGEYKDVFEHAPKWLRPTGGFGIGIQSAFMISDQVEYITRSEKELAGHRIHLTSPMRGGRVTRENCVSAPRGTTVAFEVDALKFLDYEDLGLDEAVIDAVRKRPLSIATIDVFNREQLLDMAIIICKKYLSLQIPNAIFPILIGKKGEKCGRIASPYLYYNPDQDKNDRLKRLTFKSAEEELPGARREKNNYEYSINKDANEIIFWNRQYMDCVCLHFSTDQLNDANQSIKNRIEIAFKNIRVPKEEQWLFNGEMFIDIMGLEAEKCLQVSRSGFKSEFKPEFSQRIKHYCAFGLKHLLDEYLKKDRESSEALEDTERYFVPDIGMCVTRVDFIRMVFCWFYNLTDDENRKKLVELLNFDACGQEILDCGYQTRIEDGKFSVKKQNLSGKTGEHGDLLKRPLKFYLDNAATTTGLFVCLIGKNLNDAKYFIEDLTLDGTGNIPLKTLLAELREVKDEERGTILVHILKYLADSQSPIFSKEWLLRLFELERGPLEQFKRSEFEVRCTDPDSKRTEKNKLIVYSYEEKNEKKVRATIDELERKVTEQHPLYKMFEKTPELRVKKFPLENGNITNDKVYFNPIYPKLANQLKEMKDSGTTDYKEQIEMLPKEDENLQRMICWVSNNQVGKAPNGEKYTRSEIQTACGDWLINYYEYKLRSEK